MGLGDGAAPRPLPQLCKWFNARRAMTRTSITPQQVGSLLPIPPQCIGKKLEVLLYAAEEMTEAASQVTMAQFWGIISPETGHDLQQRTEWDRLSQS